MRFAASGVCLRGQVSSNVRPHQASQMLPTVEIDGTAFETLEGFFDHFGEQALDGSFWGKNLDAFNDVLRGGFGTPEGGFRVVWRHHELSRERLGYAETVRQLQFRLQRCHPTNVANVRDQLVQAKVSQGTTVFDWLIAIIQVHGASGPEQHDNVELVLA